MGYSRSYRQLLFDITLYFNTSFTVAQHVFRLFVMSYPTPRAYFTPSFSITHFVYACSRSSPPCDATLSHQDPTIFPARLGKVGVWKPSLEANSQGGQLASLGLVT